MKMNLASEIRHFGSWRGAGRCGWHLAVCCALLATAHAADPQPRQSIRAAAEVFVRSQIPREAHGIVVTADELDSRLRFARCTGPLQAALVSGAQLQARMAVGVSCRQGVSWTVYVPVNVQSDIKVLVLRAPAIRGARLSASDVTSETRRVSGLPVAYVSDTSALARSTVSRPLSAGAILTPDALVPDSIVRQGEQVTLLASADGIEVRAAGKALQDGREGARIHVQNLASMKIVEGVVDASRVIHVSP